MRAGLMICAMFLLLIAIRCVNVNKDLPTGMTVGFIAVLCIWGSLVIDKLKDNDETE